LKLSETLAAFFAHHLRRKAEGTRIWYGGRLGDPGGRLRPGCLLDWFGDDRDIDSISLSELNEWYTSLAQRSHRWRGHPFTPEANAGLSAETLHGYGRAVKTFFRWCGRMGYIHADPAAFLELPPTPDLPPFEVTEAEIAALVRVLDNTRDLVIVRLLAYTGMRVGGLVGLRLADVDLIQRVAMVREKGRGGQQKGRYVVFDRFTADLLRRYLKERPRLAGVETLLVSRRVGPLTAEGVRCMLRRASARAGLSRVVTPHMFRHYFAGEFIRRGGDVSVNQKVLGHSDIRTTLRYLRFQIGPIRDHYDRLFGGSGDDWKLPE
jgi:integrase/recombinase XerD